MLCAEIEIPKPSKLVPHTKIDEIALAYHKAYRAKRKITLESPVDMERFVDLLEVPLLCDEIEEPDGAFFLASYSSDDGGLIIVNEKHRQLFDERPAIYRNCIGHEAGHRILRHHESFTSCDEQIPLFAEPTTPQRTFHKSSWDQYGLTKEDVMKRKQIMQELAKKALISDKARQIINQLQNLYEPEWMFWQAEHFSLCLQVPKDQLFEILEEGWDYTCWRGIYQLAERFGITGSMMKRRLIKLNLIKIREDGLPHPVQQTIQQDLLS